MKLRTMTVTQLTAYISRLIGDDPIMNACSVSGELSSFKQYPSGHVYFSLVAILTVRANGQSTSCDALA